MGGGVGVGWFSCAGGAVGVGVGVGSCVGWGFGVGVGVAVAVLVGRGVGVTDGFAFGVDVVPVITVFCVCVDAGVAVIAAVGDVVPPMDAKAAQGQRNTISNNRQPTPSFVLLFCRLYQFHGPFSDGDGGVGIPN